MYLKKVLWLVMMACLAGSLYGADLAFYEASDSPGALPDGNAGAVDVWTVTGPGGASRSYLQGYQDGTDLKWAIWDLSDEPEGTQATHQFAGGALRVNQAVSIDYSHATNIDFGQQIGIRFLSGTTVEVAYVFIGGLDWYSKYDTGSGEYVQTAKRYDNYDGYQVVFILTGPNSYKMTISEGSIPDAGFKGQDDDNADVGPVVARWEGTFTGTSIDAIQVFTAGGHGSDQWFDNLSINEDWIAKAHAPAPALDAQDVAVSGLELSWEVPLVRDGSTDNFVVPSNLDSFNVYYTEEADPNWISMVPVSVTSWDAETLRASYTPSPELAKNGTCTWRVDAVYSDSTETQGDVWTFETELTKVIITGQPVYQIVEAGETAEFAVEISTESPATFQWYKYVDGTNDIAIAGAQSSTLTIADAQVADEGRYYCVANNDANVEVLSAMALLGVERKIAYWPFEGGSVENVIAGSPATLTIGEPNMAPESIVGDAISIVKGEEIIYTDPEQASYFDICDYEITVALWIKTSDNQAWCPMVVRDGEGGKGWQLRQNGFTSDRPSFTTRGNAVEEEGTPANKTIYDDQWHYVVATCDGTIKKIYVDGVLSLRYSSDDGSVVNAGDECTTKINATDAPVAIASRVGGNIVDGLDYNAANNVSGIYDEVEIYNYALDAATIAQTYANITGSNVCLGQTNDLNDDCVVDLGDLSILASDWLGTELVAPAL
ncbi:MAG: LamG-like jellyroll fold domain-containing protein [Phycisphaerae bacterium]|jgi:hypothetical protein